MNGKTLQMREATGNKIVCSTSAKNAQLANGEIMLYQCKYCIACPQTVKFCLQFLNMYREVKWLRLESPKTARWFEKAMSKIYTFQIRT